MDGCHTSGTNGTEREGNRMTNQLEPTESAASPITPETRIDYLEERLETFMDSVDKRNKSTFKRISEWGGLVALVLSISIGSLTVFEKSILATQKSREANLSKLQDIVSQITKVNAELAALAVKMSPEDFASIGSLQNGVKFTLAKQGAKIIEEYSEFVNTETVLLFANEFLQSQDLRKAERYGRLGLKIADSDFMRAVSNRYIADALMLSQNDEKITNARAIYREALVYAKSVPPGQRYWVIGNIYRDWVLGEAAIKQCKNAADLFRTMRNDLSAPNASQTLSLIHI